MSPPSVVLNAFQGDAVKTDGKSRPQGRPAARSAEGARIAKRPGWGAPAPEAETKNRWTLKHVQGDEWGEVKPKTERIALRKADRPPAAPTGARIAKRPGRGAPAPETKTNAPATRTIAMFCFVNHMA